MITVKDEMTIDLPIEKAWEYLNDKEMVARCIPTLKSYKVLSDDVVEGIVKIQLGLIPVESRVSMEVVERDAPSRIRAKGISYLGETISSQVKEVKPGAVNKDSVGIFTVQVDLKSLGPDKTQATAYLEVEAEGKLKRVYDSIMEKKLPALRAEFIEKVLATIVERAAEEGLTVSKEPAAKVELATRTDEISYSFFGRIMNFFINLLDRILNRADRILKPSSGSRN